MGQTVLAVRYASTDEASICNALHNHQHQVDRTLDQWKWEFVSQIMEQAQIPFCVADDGGAIVGTQAFIPIPMIGPQGVFWTAKSEETLILSSYRGQGLLKKMYTHLFEYAAEHDLRYVWGFTAADKALRRVGFTVPAQTSQLIVPFYSRSLAVILKGAGVKEPRGRVNRLKMSAITLGLFGAQLISSFRLARSERRVKQSSGLQSLRLEVLTQPPEEAESLCQRFVTQWGGTTILRNSEYLRWRIFDNPYTKPIMCAAYDGETLVGWVIYSLSDDGVGYIIDLMVATPENANYSPEEVVQMLLTKAVRSVRDMGAIALRGWHVNEHPFALLVTRLSRSVGFHHIKRGHAVVIYPIDPQYSAVGDDFSDLYVTRIFTEGTVG